MVQEIEVKQNSAYGTALAAVSTQLGEHGVCAKEETTHDYEVVSQL